MPVTYHINEDYRAAVALATGLVSYEEIAATIRAALADPALQTGVALNR